MADDVTMERLAGVLVGAACADALGAGYEFGPPVPPTESVAMRGQGAFAPGEWTDDTAQSLAIAAVAASGLDLSTAEGEEAVAAGLLDWYYSPARLKDIGIHTSAVLGRAATVTGPGLADRLRDVARSKEAGQPGSSGGNGALMRSAPVAMALWRDPAQLVSTAMALGSLTHADARSSQACAVWCLAIRAALRIEEPTDLRGLAAAVDDDVARFLPEDAAYWRGVLSESFGTSPDDYYGVHPGNGYCVTTVRAAWAAVTSTPVPSASPARHLRQATEAAVRGGGDTDTVACVAGALLGALWGYSAVPLQWRRRVFGWPGLRDHDLLVLADAIHSGRAVGSGWPYADHIDYGGWCHTDSIAVHPHDADVVLSGIDAATGRIEIPGGHVDAVVSLCRVGRTELDWLALDPADHVEVRLIDAGGDANPNLQVVMDDAADAVAAFRAEGKRVLLHCVAAQSRTPSVAALYSVRHLGRDPVTALREVTGALPAASPAPALAAAVTPA
jgi:ADP-ribosyl-[dinitrogen reductase] hydrolase